MLSSVFETLGSTAEIFSPQGVKTGTTRARVSLLKNNARVLYNDKIFEPGDFVNDTFIYIGDAENGGNTVERDGIIYYCGNRFLVLKCETVSVKRLSIVWAVLKKLPAQTKNKAVGA